MTVVFDPEKTYTLGEMYHPAMEVQTEEEARDYLDAMVSYCVATHPETSADVHRTIVLANLGYWTGYFDHATATRVMTLYNTEHPVFGRSYPTPAEALAKGMEMGSEARS